MANASHEISLCNLIAGMSERAILIVRVDNGTLGESSREEERMFTDVADELGLEIERRGHTRNPLALSITLCCCFSCCCGAKDPAD